MNIQDFYVQKGGTLALIKLAERAGTTIGYLRGLLYTNKQKGKPKTPSLAMATRLVEASDGVLTLEGLANPRLLVAGEVISFRNAKAKKAKAAKTVGQKKRGTNAERPAKRQASK